MSIIWQACQGLFWLAAQQRFQERAEACLASWVLISEPIHHHFVSFYWQKQLTRPVKLQKAEKQTPSPDGSSCKVTMQREMHTGRAGEWRPSIYCRLISQDWIWQSNGYALPWLPATFLFLLSFSTPSLFLFLVRFTRPCNKDRSWKRVLGNCWDKPLWIPTISFNVHSWLW